MLKNLLKFSLLLLVGGCASLYADYPKLTAFYHQHYTEDFNDYDPMNAFGDSPLSTEELILNRQKMSAYTQKFPLEKYLRGVSDRDVIMALQTSTDLDWSYVSPAFKTKDNNPYLQLSPAERTVVDIERKILADKEKDFDKIYQEVKRGNLKNYQQLPIEAIGDILQYKYAKLPYSQRIKSSFYPEILALLHPDIQNFIWFNLEFGNVADILAYTRNILLLPEYTISAMPDDSLDEVMEKRRINIQKQLKGNFSHTSETLAPVQSMCAQVAFEFNVLPMVSKLGEKFPSQVKTIQQNFAQQCDCRIAKYAKFFSSQTLRDYVAFQSSGNLTLIRYGHANWLKAHLSGGTSRNNQMNSGISAYLQWKAFKSIDFDIERAKNVRMLSQLLLGMVYLEDCPIK